MKTIQFLSAAILLLTSFSSFADDKISSGKKNKTVAVAPYVFESSTDDIPWELSSVKAKSTTVPIAPFNWGEPVAEIEIIKTMVPAAPFVWGAADENAPAGLIVKAKNAKVPVPAHVMADPKDVPVELIGLR